MDYYRNILPRSRNLWTFNMDEYLRMSESQMFFSHPERIDELDEKLDELGGADVCYAGVGYHGHVAFNEPIISRWHKISSEEFLNARTHIVSIADDTFVINSECEAGGNGEIIPPLSLRLTKAFIFRMSLYATV